jgi:hypothetical protein
VITGCDSLVFFQSITSESPFFFVPKANQPANAHEPVPNSPRQDVADFTIIFRQYRQERLP